MGYWNVFLEAELSCCEIGMVGLNGEIIVVRGRLDTDSKVPSNENSALVVSHMMTFVGR